MATREERIEKALDTLAELCDAPTGDEERGQDFERRTAAEEILRHYRESDFTDGLRHAAIELTVNGAIPVRPMTRAEVQS